jgi:hypothetical protein
MAFCSLEEAWGQDYKSFLSPASLSPDWLSENRGSYKPPRQNCDDKPKKAPSGFNTEPERRFHLVENFDGDGKVYANNPKRMPFPPEDDSDLLIDHDEFNIPYHIEAPEPTEPGLDDYYKLIDSQYNMDTIHSYHHPRSAHDDYSEEIQYNELYSKACHSAFPFPSKIKKHLKKCKHCRSRMKGWLEELGEISSDISNDVRKIHDNVTKEIIEPAKNTIKELVPSQFRGYIDLIFFIALGIFLIFVLDTFVKLGKSFSRSRRR